MAGRLRFAIVIKGPLLPFTRRLIHYYLERAIDRSTTAVVFSHNTGTCAVNETRHFLEAVHREHANHFAWELAPPPPHLGYGYRNAQREACARGASLALARWRVSYILVHRADSSLQRVAGLEDLAAVVRNFPRSDPGDSGRIGVGGGVGGGGFGRGGGLFRGRLGFLPYQTQLTDFYGRFHLDDHVVFGRAADVVHFW